MMAVQDPRPCELGEGAFWHPERQQLFWCDILGQRVLSVEDGRPRDCVCDEPVSALGWLSRDDLLAATASGLWRLGLDTDRRERIVAIEADDPATRSNDGRADPQGGFWIGTMARDEQTRAGAIWRLYRGELRRLYGPLRIPNAICFAPDGRHAYFADTARRRLHRVTLDCDGWPADAPELLCDFALEGRNPDGAVTDAEGRLWIAQWGAWRVACHDADGRFLRAVTLPVAHVTCPVFGGPDLATLCCTTARHGLSAAELTAQPLAGLTFAGDVGARGLPAPRVIL